MGSLRKTWIVPVTATDGRKLFVSVSARTRFGALWAFWFSEAAETGDYLTTLMSARRSGPPVELNAWLKARVSV